MKKYLKYLGVALIALSTVLWLLLPLIPVLPYSLEVKGLVTAADLIIAEILFWIGAVIVGKELVQKYNFFRRFCLWLKTKLCGDKAPGA